VKIVAEEHERRWEAWAQGYAARTRRHATREEAVSELRQYFDEYADRS
jgi:predicted ArsR family transcriptional regulator